VEKPELPEMFGFAVHFVALKGQLTAGLPDWILGQPELLEMFDFAVQFVAPTGVVPNSFVGQSQLGHWLAAPVSREYLLARTFAVRSFHEERHLPALVSAP
jgi:hypothetical protein